MKIKPVILISVLFLFAAGFLGAQDNIWFTTVLKEKFTDKNGEPLTGKGVVVGDIDSGIDVFSPFFFYADGGDYKWIDVDKDGVYTDGVDAVDLNGDGAATTDETMRYIEMKNNTYKFMKTDTKNFNTDMDFLYADKNGNGKRDYGEKDGFTESDPTYGEQLFIARDMNGNGLLDADEPLTALKTSKVRSVREKDGTIRRRGTDLIKTEPDTIQHGTSVAGIVLGGHYGVQKLHGFAPDAEIVMANIKYDYTPRFVRNFPDLVKFLRDEKVNIMLFEDGEWMWEFMDGSSEEEQLSDEMARNGVTVIGGGGNLATGKMHIMDVLKKGQKTSYKFSSPKKGEGKKNDGSFISFLWRGDKKNITFNVVTPDGKKSDDLKSGSSFIRVGNYNVFYSRDVSPRGTVMFRFAFSEKDSGTVDGDWEILAKTDSDVELHGYIVDVTQSWSGTTRWESDKITDEGTVTFPSTTDSCMAIGAYAVNFGWGEQVGELCTYSGRGYLINGKMGIEICAPGHSTFTCGPDYSYTLFSGTSSAAPHVVGTAALMLQYEPTLTHSQIKQILRLTAAKDSYTGNLPNTNWGYGKLNPEEAIRYLMRR